MRDGSGTKRRRSRAEWEGIVSRYASSGMSVESFCEREDVSVSSFEVWRRRFRDSIGGFVEVSPSNSAWDIELELAGEVVLRMRRS